MRSVMKRMMVIVMIVAVLTAQMPGKAAAAAKPIMMSLNYSTVLVKVHGNRHWVFHRLRQMEQVRR